MRLAAITRFDGSLSQQADDFRAAAKAARAAARGTSNDDLVRYGARYLAGMKSLASDYDDAAEVSESADQIEFYAALDSAEPSGDAINSIAEDGGLESCALEGPEPGETGVSQSGHPAIMVPDHAYPPAKEPTDETVTYPLRDGAALSLDRMVKLRTGTVPVEQAAEKFEHRDGAKKAVGTVLVFSGQGAVWALDCGAGLNNEPTPELEAACDRAVAHSAS